MPLPRGPGAATPGPAVVGDQAPTTRAPGVILAVALDDRRGVVNADLAIQGHRPAGQQEYGGCEEGESHGASGAEVGVSNTSVPAHGSDHNLTPDLPGHSPRPRCPQLAHVALHRSDTPKQVDPKLLRPISRSLDRVGTLASGNPVLPIARTARGSPRSGARQGYPPGLGCGHRGGAEDPGEPEGAAIASTTTNIAGISIFQRYQCGLMRRTPASKSTDRLDERPESCRRGIKVKPRHSGLRPRPEARVALDPPGRERCDDPLLDRSDLDGHDLDEARPSGSVVLQASGEAFETSRTLGQCPLFLARSSRLDLLPRRGLNRRAVGPQLPRPALEVRPDIRATTGPQVQSSSTASGQAATIARSLSSSMPIGTARLKRPVRTPATGMFRALRWSRIASHRRRTSCSVPAAS